MNSLPMNDLLGSVEISVEESGSTNYDPAIACGVVCCCVVVAICVYGCLVSQH